MEIKTFSDYIKESLEEVSMEETNTDIPYKELFNAVRNYGKTKPTDNKTIVPEMDNKQTNPGFSVFLDAVLNYDRNNYIYMCAKSDGSGWHLFTDDYSEHTRNANAYRSYVQSLNIKK